MDSRRGADWQPILDGELAARAEEAVSAIADALAEPGAIPAASLGSGAPGLALLFGYLERARPGLGHAQRAGHFLDAAIDELASGPVDASLYGGFTGVAWVSEHLAPDTAGDEDPNEQIDEALLSLLEESPWRGDYDLIGGLAGFAVHALERLGRPSGRRCLELIVDRLAETAVRQDGRATWKTLPQHLTEPTRREHPDGYFNVGVAHGVPGVVAILAPCAAAGVGGARELLGEAAAWVLDWSLPDHEGSGRFPYFVGPAIAPQAARFAWCYGDPGVAAALLSAAHTAGDERLEEAALDVAREAAAQPTSRKDVVDAALCHGAAGVAHLFNRMHQSTGDAALADAARRWFARALEMRRPGEGVGGFPSWSSAGSSDGGWRRDPGLLTGAAGVALALLGAVSRVEPAWDRILLASTVRP